MGHAHEHVEVISHDEREVRACEPEGVASIRAEGQGEREAVVRCVFGPRACGSVSRRSARFKCPLQVPASKRFRDRVRDRFRVHTLLQDSAVS